MRVVSLATVALALVASRASGQTPTVQPRLTAGLSSISAGLTSGSGMRLSALAPLGPKLGEFELTAQLTATRGTTSGSPFACEIGWVYCLGRSERLTMGAATLGLESPKFLQALPIYLRGEFGVYVARTLVTETEGPTLTCIRDGKPVSCPSNPPFRDFTSTKTQFGPGYGMAIGFQRWMGGMQWSLEVTGHGYRTPQHEIGVIGLSLGVGR